MQRRKKTICGMRYWWLLLFLGLLPGCCIEPFVPESLPEVQAALPGYLIVECLEPGPEIGKLDFTAGVQVQPLIARCATSCRQTDLAPDGTQIVYRESYSEKRDETTIWALSLEGDSAQPLVQDSRYKLSPAWGPGGERIAYLVGHNPYYRTAPQETPWITLGTAAPPILIYRYYTLHMLDLLTQTEVQLIPAKGKIYTFDWAPDGEQIAVSACLEDSNQDGEIDVRDREQLYIVSLADQTLEHIPSVNIPGESMLDPKWSPDGRYIAYFDGHNDLVIIAPQEHTEIARLRAGAVGAYAWSPDSTQIAYVGYTEPADSIELFVDLFILDLETGISERFTCTNMYTVFSAHEGNGIKLYDLLWSPDGEFIAMLWYTADENHLVVTRVMDKQLTYVTKIEPCHKLIAWGE